MHDMKLHLPRHMLPMSLSFAPRRHTSRPALGSGSAELLQRLVEGLQRRLLFHVLQIFQASSIDVTGNPQQSGGAGVIAPRSERRDDFVSPVESSPHAQLFRSQWNDQVRLCIGDIYKMMCFNTIKHMLSNCCIGNIWKQKQGRLLSIKVRMVFLPTII